MGEEIGPIPEGFYPGDPISGAFGAFDEARVLRFMRHAGLNVTAH